MMGDWNRATWRKQSSLGAAMMGLAACSTSPGASSVDASPHDHSSPSDRTVPPDHSSPLDGTFHADHASPPDHALLVDRASPDDRSSPVDHASPEDHASPNDHVSPLDQAADQAAPPPLVDVLTHHNDVGRSGANLSETTLTTANVAPSTFGALFSVPVDGLIYAQPLYVSHFTIGGVTRNVLVVATANNSVYQTSPASTEKG